MSFVFHAVVTLQEMRFVNRVLLQYWIYHHSFPRSVVSCEGANWITLLEDLEPLPSGTGPDKT